MRIIPAFTALALGLVTFVCPAVGQTPAPTEQQRVALFQAADTNRNGLLEKSEWLATLSAPVRANADSIWLRLDPAGVGYVSEETFVTANGRLPAATSH